MVKSVGIHTPKKTAKVLKRLNEEVSEAYTDSSYGNDEMDSVHNGDAGIGGIYVFIPRKNTQFDKYIVSIGEYADPVEEKCFDKLKSVIKYLKEEAPKVVAKHIGEPTYDERNIAETAALVSHHLFDKVYAKLDGGVMNTIGHIADATLKFIEEHENVERESNWDDFTHDKGYSDWEEYLVATVEKNLRL